MSGPSIVDLLALIPQIRASLDAALAVLEAATPDAAHASEQEAAAILHAAIDKLDMPTLTSDLAHLGAVLAAGRGISGGGFNANLS